jgi:pantoate kinase
MSESRSAFCPGHVTAFFEICDQSDNPLERGSRGAGLSLTLGARSAVSAYESADQSIKVRIDGIESQARTTRNAISFLIGDKSLKVEVNTALDLPVEQGFAMSAAGSLSASLALCSLLNLPVQKAYEAAHIAEVKNKTGLGDVAGIFAGAAEIRLEPGLSPFGVVERIEASSPVVLAVVGKPIKTNDILTDPVKRRKISDSGKKCILEFAEHRTLEHMFALGMEFLEDSELFSKEVLEAMVIADQHGMATMAMLGNSLFGIGDTPEMAEALRPLGQVFICEIDQKGPRLLETVHS